MTFRFKFLWLSQDKTLKNILRDSCHLLRENIKTVVYKMSIDKVTELYTILQHLKKMHSQANDFKQITQI